MKSIFCVLFITSCYAATGTPFSTPDNKDAFIKLWGRVASGLLVARQTQDGENCQWVDLAEAGLEVVKLGRQLTAETNVSLTDTTSFIVPSLGDPYDDDQVRQVLCNIAGVRSIAELAVAMGQPEPRMRQYYQYLKERIERNGHDPDQIIEMYSALTSVMDFILVHGGRPAMSGLSLPPDIPGSVVVFFAQRMIDQYGEYFLADLIKEMLPSFGLSPPDDLRFAVHYRDFADFLRGTLSMQEFAAKINIPPVGVETFLFGMSTIATGTTSPTSTLRYRRILETGMAFFYEVKGAGLLDLQ